MAAPGLAAPATAPTYRFAALRSHNFRALWLGVIVSNVGGQMQVAGQLWLVRDLHPEPIYLGLVSLATALPLVLLTPFGGAVADRVPRRRLLVFAQVAMLLQSGVLAALTLAGMIDVWGISLMALLNSLFVALDNPARQSLMPELVARDQLHSAVSLNSMVWSGSALLGPALGGLLLPSIGPGGLFTINALSYLAVIYAVAIMRDLPPDDPAPPKGSFGKDLQAGIAFALKDPLVRTLLLLLATASLLGRSYLALMPIFARDVLDVGPQGYGLLLSVPGLGAVVGGLWLASRRGRLHQDRDVLLALFAFCAFLGGFALSRVFLLSLPLQMGAAVATAIMSASAMTLIQLRAPQALRGRVISLAAVANMGMGNLGGLFGGIAATAVGAPFAVFGGVAVVAIVGAYFTVHAGWRRVVADVMLDPAVSTQTQASEAATSIVEPTSGPQLRSCN